jgi:hypothetical protein
MADGAKDVLIRPLSCMRDTSSDGGENMLEDGFWEFDKKSFCYLSDTSTNGLEDVLIGPLCSMSEASSDWRE